VKGINMKILDNIVAILRITEGEKVYLVAFETREEYNQFRDSLGPQSTVHIIYSVI